MGENKYRTTKALGNLCEVVQWVTGDERVKALLISTLKEINHVGNGKEGEKKKTLEVERSTLKRLKEAGFIQCSEEYDFHQITLTDRGRKIAGYLWQHEPQKELKELFEKMPLRSDSVFLDLGCGSGPALVRAGEFCPFLIVGVDIERDALRVARSFLGSYAARCGLIQADITKLPFKNGIFSHVCCRLVMPYVDQKKAIAEVDRVLRIGGVVFLHVHTFCYYAHLLLREVGKWKKVLVNGFCLFNGLFFHLTGWQLKIRFSGKTFMELYHTEAGMKRLFRNTGIAALRIDNGELFKILGTKDRRYGGSQRL